MRHFLALSLLTAFCSPPCLYATTYYVRVNGAGTSCAQAQTDNPTLALGDVYNGLACLFAGDTLIIHAGTYNVSAGNDGASNNISSHFFGTAGQPITITAAAGETVVFRPPPTAHGGLMFDFYDPTNRQIAQYTIWKGFIFDMFTGDPDTACHYPAGGGTLPCDGAAGSFRFEEGSGDHVVIQNCEFKNYMGGAISFFGGGNYGQFLNNYVHDYKPYTPANQARCMATPGWNDHCWSVGLYDYSNYTLYRGNIFSNMGREGIQYWDEARGAVQGKVFDRNYWYHNGYQLNSDGSTQYTGAAIINGTNSGTISPIVITNNVFDDNDTVLEYPSFKTIFANNTVVNNQKGILNGIGAQGVIQNNIFYGNGSDVALPYSPAVFANNLCGTGGCPAGNRNGVDPLFTSGASGAADHFQLRSNSPAINQGVGLSQVSTDYAGIPRPQGSDPDIGAYEFGGASSTPCDVNQDGSPNVIDVQLAANQAVGASPFIPFGQPGSADINRDGMCSVLDVQRVVNAVLGGTCVSP